MKKLLLVVFAIIIVTTLFAQKHVLRSMEAAPNFNNIEAAPNNSQPNPQTDKQVYETELINGINNTYVPLGQSDYILGFQGNSRTYLWADPNLNSVVFVHRGLSSGNEVRINYDISVDGGNTWNNNIELDTLGTMFVYPQCGIINPPGNTNPDSAYFTYMVSNVNGLSYGSNLLTDTLQPNFSYTHQTYDTALYDIGDAFTITQQGVAWNIGSKHQSDYSNYTGQLLINEGEIVDGEIDYTQSFIDVLSYGDGINDLKIAFAPNGQIGYILIMSDSESDPQPYTNYHPVLLKTTDGGVTWSDPIHVQLGGMDGIESVKYYWSDEIIESIDIYGPGFNRDEVYYNLGYSADLIVDGYGNPHITGIIGISSVEGWYASEGTMATWHVYSNDGGNTWGADALYDNKFLEGDVGGIYQYNRPYVASSYDGASLFFSWIDTDLEGAEGNTNPNIFVVGYCVSDNAYTDVENVTTLSPYWFSAFFGCASQYIFTEEGIGGLGYEIPFVFAEFTVPGDPFNDINYWYIDDFSLWSTNPCDIIISVDNNNFPIFTVNQNIPNPAVTTTDILVTTKETGTISLNITNILGQVIHYESVNNNALAHTINIDVSSLEAGIYFYTVEIGNSSITKKMVVR